MSRPSWATADRECNPVGLAAAEPDHFRKDLHRSQNSFVVDSIDYNGTLNGDGTEIEGRWSIRSVWSGKFLMIRSAGKEEAVARKAVQRA